MPRPGNNYYPYHGPGLHRLDHNHKCKRQEEQSYLLVDLGGENLNADPGHRILLFVPSSCDNVVCGPNEHCNKGCCVCNAGYARDRFGNCVPEDTLNDQDRPVDPTPDKPEISGRILQESTGLIYTQSNFILNYDIYSLGAPSDPCAGVVCGVGQICVNGNCVADPNYDPCSGVTCPVGKICVNGVCVTDPSYDPCAGVACGPNEICSKGTCIPDPNYNPCLGVYCPEGYVCKDGNCVRPTNTTALIQEDEGLIFTHNYDILNYE